MRKNLSFFEHAARFRRPQLSKCRPRGLFFENAGLVCAAAASENQNEALAFQATAVGEINLWL